MYDADYAFQMTAPKGWVLDNVAGGQEVCAVFYPVGSSWKDSPVVFYVNTKQKSAKVQSAEDAMQDDMAAYHHNGSPHSAAKKVKELKLKGTGRQPSMSTPATNGEITNGRPLSLR